MASLVLDIPEALLERLRKRARAGHLTIREVVLSALEREAERGEYHERLASCPATDLGVDAAELIRDARARREGGDE